MKEIFKMMEEYDDLISLGLTYNFYSDMMSQDKKDRDTITFFKDGKSLFKIDVTNIDANELFMSVAMDTLIKEYLVYSRRKKLKRLDENRN